MKKILPLSLAGMAFYGCQEDLAEVLPANIPAARAAGDSAVVNDKGDHNFADYGGYGVSLTVPNTTVKAGRRLFAIHVE